MIVGMGLNHAAFQRKEKPGSALPAGRAKVVPERSGSLRSMSFSARSGAMCLNEARSTSLPLKSRTPLTLRIETCPAWLLKATGGALV